MYKRGFEAFLGAKMLKKVRCWFTGVIEKMGFAALLVSILDRD